MHIVLVGYRCAGKTTVGKILADRLGMRFFDTDKLVEAKARMSVARIFEEKGEGEFRNLETEVIEEICGGDGKVIAVGGGGVVRQRNLASLRRTSRILYLKVPPEEVRARLEKDPAAVAARPALTRDDVIEETREMMARREPFYREAAETTIDAASKKPEEIAEEIVRYLQENPERKVAPQEKTRTRRNGWEQKAAKKPLERGDPDSVGLFPREK
jgi:shikimate kinase